MKDNQGPDPSLKYPLEKLDLFVDTKRVCFIKNIIKNPNIEVGDYTYYDDPVSPDNFEDNVLYLYPFSKEKLIIGKFCTIATGVKFIMSGANHKMDGFSTFPFSVFKRGWEKGFDMTSLPSKGDTVVGNDVWLAYDATVMPGVSIGDGAIIGSKAVVTKDVAPYSIVGGNPARVIKMRFDDQTINALLEILNTGSGLTLMLNSTNDAATDITTGTNQNLTIVPEGLGVTIIGDAGTPSLMGLSNDNLFVSGRLEVDGSIFFDNIVKYTGASGSIIQDFRVGVGLYGQNVLFTDDGIHFGVRADENIANNNFIFTNTLHVGKDFDHNIASPDTTIFIQSSTNPDDDNTRYLSLAYTGNSTGNISVVAGNLTLGVNSDGLIKLLGNTLVTKNFTVASQFFVDTSTGNVGVNTTTPTQALTVVGDGNVTGDFFVGGNVSATNVFLPALAFAHNNGTQIIVSDFVWQNITFDDEPALKLRISHTEVGITNTTFTVLDTGIYDISFFITMEDTAANPTSNAAIEIRRNSVNLDGSRVEIDFTKQNQEIELSNRGFFELTANDIIEFLVITDTSATVRIADHDTFDDTESAIINILRVV